MNPGQIYHDSNGDATRQLYGALEALGPRGVIAMNLFRACKASERAKKYTRRFRGTAYDKKNWSMGLLCDALMEHSDTLQIVWGWAKDPKPPIGYPWILYVELPTGQASFHAAQRGKGPDYGGKWNSARTSATVIICYASHVLGVAPIVADELAPAPTEAQWKKWTEAEALRQDRLL